MIKRKVCMMGAFAVGKTSLVQQHVHSIFSSRYHTTVGVKIDKKSLRVGAEPVDLIIWDLHGEDDFQTLPMSYLRGASGLIYVVDGTRRLTLDVALQLLERAESTVGKLPSVVALNKADLSQDWEVSTADLYRIAERGLPVFHTSAKTGGSVDALFLAIAEASLSLS
jgi:small GTP-binding protein